VKIFFLFLLIFSAAILPAQTAAEMEALLSTRAVSFAQASRFALVVADWVDETAGTAAAYSLALEQKWLPQRVSSGEVSPDSPIRLGELCFLIMEAFGMKGSFLYAVLPGPHYAFRELDYLRLIPGQRDPGAKVSGERFLQILGMVAAYTQADRDPAETSAPVVAAETPEEAPREALPPVAVVEAPEEAPPPVAVVETPRPPPPVTIVEAPEETPLPVAVAEVPEEAPPVVAVVETPEETPPPPVAVVEKPRPPPPPAAVVERPRETPAAEKPGIIALGTIRFPPNSAGLEETEKARLRNMAALLPEYPDRKILIGGYTALAGTMRGRLQISRERAQATADFLVSLGACRPEEIIIQAYGAQRPLGNNTGSEGRAPNRRVEIALLNEAYYKIQFLPDSTELTEEGKAKLRELASVLSRYPGVNVLVGGYTALAGTMRGRLQISRERARAAADFLAALDARGARNISVRAYGAAQPLGDNASEEGRALNRRVEITLFDE
jgi:outer membrane protein OmpA-like peptidoglycan-associated protein